MLRYPMAVIIPALLLSACAATPPSRHYLLSPLAMQTGTPAQPDNRLGIGLISLPDYLNRTQLVVRGNGGRLLMRDGERWGEPLEDSVRRVLGENLGRLLGSGRLVFLPAPAGLTVTNRLQLEITAFDAGTDQELQLSARWSLSQISGTTSLHESHIKVALKADDASATVAAMNEALLQLAGEIVAKATNTTTTNPVPDPAASR
jgi:uncharacterized protein